MQRIAVFGGSFNPPTVGHRDAIDQILAYFDTILLVPSLHHAFAKQSLPMTQRLEMLALFMQFWPNKRDKIQISHIEAQIQAQLGEERPIYTYDVLSALNQQYQHSGIEVELHFVLGPDLARPDVWEKFYRYQDLETQFKRLIVQERNPVRSTQVRQLIAQKGNHESPEALFEELNPLVGTLVSNYIIKHHCYFSENHDHTG